MKKKAIGICVCMLLIATTVLPVAGNINKTIDEENKVIADETHDFMIQSGKEKIPINVNFDKTNLNPTYKSLSRGEPPYEFIKEPTTIMTSHYDYMPGSYASHPIRIQTDHGNGHYLTFHGQESSTASRRQYWAYLDSSCNIQDWDVITSYNTRQGYGSIGIHPATGDCIASWHENRDGDLYETALTYDDYDDSETPGFWQDPMTILATNDLEYIWPYIYVGPSPLEGYVRVYQVANDYTNLPSGNPCEDVRIMYTDVQDVNGADLSGLLDIGNWENVTVMTDWRDKSCRPFQAFAVDYDNPGKVAFIGCAAWLEGDLGDMPVDEGAFVWESFDYGETWSTSNLHSDGPGNPIYLVDNPGHFPEAPDELEVTIGGWHNTALYDSDGNLHWTYLQQYGYTDESGSYYFPDFMPQAEMVWDGSSFTFHEVPELPGTDPLSGHSVPWDEDNTYPVIAWSTYPSTTLPVFHENVQKQAVNTDNNWMIQVWVDGTYHQLGTDGDPNYEDYIEHPIVFISVSVDNGDTWFPPIELTDIFSEKFDFSNQITVYPYVCDQIIDIGDDWGQVYMYYFDDTEFGSKVHGTGADGTGKITYCSIKIKFSDFYADAGGPYEALVGEDILFEGSATGGQPPYTYHWDFGNGDTADEQNPVYTYADAGIYDVVLTVTDDEAHTASDTTTATILGPNLDIDIITGGLFKVKADIQNTRNVDATGVQWRINLSGGLILLGRKTAGVDDIPGEGEITVTSKSILGFGSTTVKVEAWIPDGSSDTREQKAIVLLFFIQVKPGG
ncbi:MAG: PKD domain-containing protein [Thermoplasmatales archaeon]|nr:MAG: PKD domain-containing protein [Thermoplasmatales archaeon]